jgi:glycosyltransferase involved in cell wall biosynthesis
VTAEKPVQADLSWDGVWIVIPAYNEARTIRVLALEALAQCPRVIVVDDGSNDGTAGQLEGLPVTLLIHETNQGKAASLRTAFRHTLNQGARCAISIDGDGQHALADAAGLLRVWLTHPKCIVIGSRLHDKSQFPPARYRPTGLPASGSPGPQDIPLRTLNPAFASIPGKSCNWR